jgi:hypothetical protein
MDNQPAQRKAEEIFFSHNNLSRILKHLTIQLFPPMVFP